MRIDSLDKWSSFKTLVYFLMDLEVLGPARDGWDEEDAYDRLLIAGRSKWFNDPEFTL